MSIGGGCDEGVVVREQWWRAVMGSSGGRAIVGSCEGDGGRAMGEEQWCENSGG